MAELTGWAGLLLVAVTFIPFILRRLILQKARPVLFSRNHHNFALAGLLVLTVHGLLALTGRRGWGWGVHAFWKGHLLSGVLAWSVLVAVVVLALLLARRKSGSRVHCWLSVLLVLLTINHIF